MAPRLRPRYERPGQFVVPLGRKRLGSAAASCATAFEGAEPPAGLRYPSFVELNIVQELIETHLPGSRASVDDFMGAGGDHLAVRVEAEQFVGKSLIEQHKMIYAAVQEHLDSGAIHALSITTVPIAPGAST